MKNNRKNIAIWGMCIVLVLLVILYAGNAFLSKDTSLEIPQNSPISNIMSEEKGEEKPSEEVASTIKSPTEVTDYRDLPVKKVELEKVAENLDAPWAFTWLPNGNILLNERFGVLKLINVENDEVQEITGLPKVLAAGQGGLLDVTVHPNFEEKPFVYISYAHGTQEQNRLRVARGVLNENALENVEVIFEVAQTKSGTQHFGSRFVWLPDETLLFSVGDGGNPPTSYNGELIREQAQLLNAHLGKVIRINDDGTLPEDNPFVGRPDVLPEIFSYGHRNIQGIAYDSVRGRLIASEHGSKGGDEMNIVESGKNYGWPRTTYSTEYNAWGTPISPDQTLPNMEDPLGVWTPSIAPSSVVFYDGNKYETWNENIFLAAMLLREDNSIKAYASRPAGAIFRLETDENGKIVNQELLDVGDVRVRSIAQGPDGYLYVLTDKTTPQSRAGENAGVLWKILD